MPFEDGRGSYTQLYADDLDPVSQVSLSFTHARVIRGFHQTSQLPQSKLVHVLTGKMIDFFFDPETGVGGYCCLRPNERVFLSPDAYHAFLAIEPVRVIYFCDRVWQEQYQGGYNIESILPGLMTAGRLIRSDKDYALPPWTREPDGLRT